MGENSMNILHMKYAYEVAKTGSLSKASEALLIATPNLSRCIKELETDLGITIFDRTTKGMQLTPDGEEFMNYAKSILLQIAQVENIYSNYSPKKQRLTVSVPRASYIAEAFAQFSKTLSDENIEIFYKETNSQRTLHNMFNHDYKLGIIRYASNYDKYFEAFFEEKDLNHEIITDFTYSIAFSAQSPLTKFESINPDNLKDFIEIAHADPYVPSLPVSKVVKEELSENTNRRIFVFERASQFELLSDNPETFMWVSPVPDTVLNRYNLVQKKCADNTKVYKDVLVYKKGYKLTKLDKQFISVLYDTKKKYLDK